MKLSKRQCFYLLSPIFALSAYPVFVLFYTWAHVASSPLDGGKNGPLDAYRHTLASAVVAYTLNEQAVFLVTRVMERTTSAPNLMDKHNNLIGAQIGVQAKRFTELKPLVEKTVLNGKVNADTSAQVTWLPPKYWRDSILW